MNVFHNFLHFSLKHSNCRVIRKFNQVILRIVYQCEISLKANIDKEVYFNHCGFGIVVNPNAVIKRGANIQHSVTIGEIDKSHKAPIIEENVMIGARAIILGGIRIGKNAKIGAGAVVLCDVPEDSIAVGVPARIIYK